MKNTSDKAYHELTITIAETFKDQLVLQLTRLGCLGVIETEEGIIAYFSGTADMRAVLAELDLAKALLIRSGHSQALSFKQSLIQDQDWNESWKKGFTPLDVGERFTILPPWEEQRKDRINLVIDPGMAFGTGHHETTRSCLVLMEKYDQAVPKKRFLDLGTGTGLLAIAASKLGYEQVVAVDTDPLAVEAAHMNIRLNRVANIEVLAGSVADTTGRFDFIAANIISGVLVLLAPSIASQLNQPGLAVLSGILAEQADEVVAAMLKEGLTLRERYPDGKWISLVVAFT